ATNERLARRAAEIDAGAPGQSLLRHGDAVPSRRCGGGRDQAGRPAAENHQVVVTAGSVGPTRWVALLYRLLVVTVRGEKFNSRHRVSSCRNSAREGRRGGGGGGAFGVEGGAEDALMRTSFHRRVSVRRDRKAARTSGPATTIDDRRTPPRAAPQMPGRSSPAGHPLHAVRQPVIPV